MGSLTDWIPQEREDDFPVSNIKQSSLGASN